MLCHFFVFVCEIREEMEGSRFGTRVCINEGIERGREGFARYVFPSAACKLTEYKYMCEQR